MKESNKNVLEARNMSDIDLFKKINMGNININEAIASNISSDNLFVKVDEDNKNKPYLEEAKRRYEEAKRRYEMKISEAKEAREIKISKIEKMGQEGQLKEAVKSLAPIKKFIDDNIKNLNNDFEKEAEDIKFKIQQNRDTDKTLNGYLDSLSNTVQPDADTKSTTESLILEKVKQEVEQDLFKLKEEKNQLDTRLSELDNKINENKKKFPDIQGSLDYIMNHQNVSTFAEMNKIKENLKNIHDKINEFKKQFPASEIPSLDADLMQVVGEIKYEKDNDRYIEIMSEFFEDINTPEDMLYKLIEKSKQYTQETQNQGYEELDYNLDSTLKYIQLNTLVEKFGNKFNIESLGSDVNLNEAELKQYLKDTGQYKYMEKQITELKKDLKSIEPKTQKTSTQSPEGKEKINKIKHMFNVLLETCAKVIESMKSRKLNTHINTKSIAQKIKIFKTADNIANAPKKTVNAYINDVKSKEEEIKTAIYQSFDSIMKMIPDSTETMKTFSYDQLQKEINTTVDNLNIDKKQKKLLTDSIIRAITDSAGNSKDMKTIDKAKIEFSSIEPQIQKIATDAAKAAVKKANQEKSGGSLSK